MSDDKNKELENAKEKNAATEEKSIPESIIIAEDSLPNRKILTHLLTKLGYNVHAFDDGRPAWEALDSGKIKNLVAIISDIMMPLEDGLQFLTKVRESDKDFKNIPFILATAVQEKEYIIKARKLNVNGYILKPLTFHRVTAKLQELFPEKIFPRIAG